MTKHKYTNEIYKKDNLVVRFCSRCGFYHLDPMPSDEELYKLYTEQFYQIFKPKYEKKDTPYWKEMFSLRMQNCYKIIGGKKISVLDVGCGGGDFLNYVEKRYNTNKLIGVDPTFQKSEGDRFLRVKGFFESISMVDTFDLVVCEQVLNHTKNPFLILKKINQCLKPGGVAFFEEPNDFSRIQFYDYTELYWIVPDHVNYWKAVDFENLVLKVNDVIDFEDHWQIVLRGGTFPMDLFRILQKNYGIKRHKKVMDLYNVLNLDIESYNKLFEYLYETDQIRSFHIWMKKKEANNVKSGSKTNPYN